MKKTAIVLNWIMLALLGISFVVMGIQYPSTVSGGSILALLPYATALLVFKTNSHHRVLIGASLLLNGFMVVVGLAFVVIGLSQGEPLKAVVPLLILLPPPLLNCVILKWAWARARVKTAQLNEPIAEQDQQ